MDKRFLGRTGLEVSELCLGTMTFGSETDQSTAHRILDDFVAAGGTMIDTADTYSAGVLRRDHRQLAQDQEPRRPGDRDQGVRGGRPRTAGPRRRARKHILAGVEASLRRLQTDFIDLYQIHVFDDATPLEET